MSGKFLLDTNIVIANFAGDTDVQKRLASAKEIFIPAIVLGELFYGAYKSSHIVENIVRVDEFAAKTVVLVCDETTAREYGRIKNALRAKGRHIPENDIWIAAIATQYNLTLVIRDKHFAEVDALVMEAW